MNLRRVGPVAAVVVALVLLASLVGGGAAQARAVGRVFSIPTTDSEPASIISGPGGDLWFTESNGYKIGRVTTAGEIAEFPVPVGPYDTNPGEGPTQIVSSGGYLWFTSDVGESIFRMDTAGDLARVDWDGHDAIGLAPSDTAGIWLFDGLAGDGNGGSIDVQRVDGSGTITPCETDDLNQVYAPMTLGPDGSVWYAEDTVSGDDLVKLGDGCDQELKLPIPTANALYDVTSLAFSSNGTLWFTGHQPHDHGITVGGAVGELAPGSASPRIVWSQSTLGNAAPESLTAAPGATMYFATSDGIGRASASGEVTFASLSGYQPASVAEGPDGNLWFVDTTANRVGEVSPASLFGSGPGRGALAPAPRVTVPGQTLAAVRRRGSLSVRCALAAAGTCTVTADVTAATARALHLRVPRRARTVTLARASVTLRRRGAATLRLHLPRAARPSPRLRRLTVTLAVTSTRRGTTARHVQRRITLRG